MQSPLKVLECQGQFIFVFYIHFLSTLIGAPVHQLIYSVIKLATRMAAAQCMKSCRYRSSISYCSYKNVRIKTNCNF